MNQVSEKDINFPIEEIYRKYQMREVNTNSAKYLGIKNSMKTEGQIQPISIREKDETGKYPIHVGHHRYQAALDLGWKTIKAIITFRTEEDALFDQMSENLNRADAKPGEFAGQLKRILARPEFFALTKPEILAKLGWDRSPQWLATFMKINNLLPELKDLVDQGHITLSNAKELARLPADHQMNFKEQAIAQDYEKLRLSVNEVVSELKAEKKGVKVEKKWWTGARLRKQPEIRTVIEAIREGRNTLVNDVINEAIKTNKSKSVLVAITCEEVLKWVLHLDPASLKEKEDEKRMSKDERERALKTKSELALKVKEMMKDPESLSKLQSMIDKAKNNNE